MQDNANRVLIASKNNYQRLSNQGEDFSAAVDYLSVQPMSMLSVLVFSAFADGVVNKDASSRTVVGGVPAKVISRIIVWEEKGLLL